MVHSIIVLAYMLLYGRRREFEYLVNFEPVDSIGSLSQMGIQIFIERECMVLYTSPGTPSTWAAFSLSLILFYLLIYLGLKGKKSSLGSRIATLCKVVEHIGY
jgi:hypothetical protein